MTDRMTWCRQGCDEPEMHSRCFHEDARTLCAWVNALGGEARFGQCEDCGQRHVDGGILITGSDPKKPLVVKPGDTVIDTGDTFLVGNDDDEGPSVWRLFRVAAAGGESE